MIDSQIQLKLDHVAARLRKSRCWTGLAIAGGVLAFISWLCWQNIESLQDSRPTTVGALCALSVIGIFAALIFSRVGLTDYGKLAKRIENAFPDLDSRLLATVEIETNPANSKASYLNQALIRQTNSHGVTNSWTDVVSLGGIWASRALSVGTWGAFLILLGLLMTRQSTSTLQFAENDTDATPILSSTTLLAVEPGDTAIELGTSLIVSANYGGSLPREATLIVTLPDGAEERVPMSNRFDDPVFDARYSGVKSELQYRVEMGGQTSDTYQVEVFEVPKLVKADAVLEYPDYLARDPKQISNVRRVSAIEGTRIRLQMFLNKDVDLIELREKDADAISGNQVSNGEHLYEFEFVLNESVNYRLHLMDDAGRENRDPPLFIFTALKNNAPKIEIVRPGKDVSVSALEELVMEAKISDDFQLNDYGISYSFNGNMVEQSLMADENTDPNLPLRRITIEHMLLFESLGAKPNDMFSYYFWADDNASDGSSRRTFSDMFFIDVRPFDEIFRQGEAQSQQQSQQQQQQEGMQGEAGGQAAELLELQKQIINGTWNVIRRETRTKVTEAFANDVDLLRTSQEQALTQAEELAQNVSDENLQSVVEQVQLKMQEAQLKLSKALLDSDVQPLHEALAAERAAFEGLIRLRASEYEVSQQRQRLSQQSQSSSSSSSQRQAQLDQLDLSNEENRYAEETQAQSEEEQEQERENRQILSRLRELAQRQSDLNEQLQELQTALEEAETEEEREEIRRQLERLREEQEEILRETDELADRTEQAEDSEQMEQAREQLEQAREEVDRANQALQNNEVSQAAAAGARAENQFENLRDDFQRLNSSAFDERVEDLSQKANQLREREREIAEQLNPQNDEESLSLRDDRSDQLQEAFDQQQKELGELMEDIRQLVQDAEETEPLMAGTLYDAYREAEQNQIPEALEQAEQLYRGGFQSESQELEQMAREGIENLANEVDRAAEDILGDQEDALRRAEQTLDDLIDDLNDELRSQGAQTEQADGQRGQPGESQQGESRQAQSQSSESQTGESQQGEQSGEQSGEQGNQSQGSETNSDQQGNQQPGQAQQNSEQSEQSQEGQQQGGQQGSGQQSDEQQSNNQQGSGQQQGNQPSENQQQNQQGSGGNQQQQGQQQSGRQPGQSQQGQAQGGQQGSNQQRDQGQQQGQRGGGRDQEGQPQEGGLDQLFRSSGPDEGTRPITGDNYREWSDRMRDVEEMINDPELRSEATRIRERVREIRRDYRRHSEEPNWDMVTDMVAVPLAELRQRVREELLKRESKEALVPIDRDPVPDQFSEDVSEYYERLGSGEQ